MRKQLQILFGASLIILLGIGIYRYQNNSEGLREDFEDSKWRTFKKVSLKDIKSYPTTKNEKKDMQVDDRKDIANHHSRVPAAVSIADVKHRSWKGVGPRPLSAEIDNDYNPLWKEELGKNLLRFLRPNTKTIVKREASALLKYKGQNLMVEQILVKIKSPEGRHYGYSAYADSSNGKILYTWNRTIHEQFARGALRLSPSKRKP